MKKASASFLIIMRKAALNKNFIIYSSDCLATFMHGPHNMHGTSIMVIYAWTCPQLHIMMINPRLHEKLND